MAEEKEIPRYLALYRRLRRDITEGRFRYGERLPSKRQLAEENACSVITAEHCYSLLEEEGYLEARERSGYYVCYREEDAFPVGEEEQGETLRRELWESLPPEGSDSVAAPETEERAQEEGGSQIGAKEGMPFSVLAKTSRRVLTEYGERLLKKSPGSGLPELRAAIAEYLRRSRGIQVSSEQIVIGSGAEYLYTLVVQMLGRERVYGLEDPSYEKIRQVYEASGACCELLRLGEEGILSGELRRSRASVLHVTPFNSYPSGVTASASKRAEYIRWAEGRNAVLVEDDFDSEFSGSTKTEDTLFSLAPEKTVLYMNSFSKTVAPSLRVAYMVLPGERLQELLGKISFYSCTVPVFDQYLLSELLRSGDFERHINRVRRRRRQKYGTG